ncbi:MAG: BamA/TamA family outer membrane protein [Spirochaetes bacterium]|jgi:outer membrane protein assembly factor BamA|nr:BamA/TamA family outer membrane protein [Spirochaetota bacterium]
MINRSLRLIIYCTILLQLHSLPLMSQQMQQNENLRYDRHSLKQKQQQFIEKHGDLPILQFTISGASKTDQVFILNQASAAPGDRLSKFNPYSLMNSLKKSNIFSDIDFHYHNNGETVTVEIAVVEKWTLIPLPIFYSNAGSTGGGLFLIESNLFGYGKQFFIGATYATNGWNALSGYRDPGLLGSRFKMNIFLRHKNTIYETGTMDGNTDRKYKCGMSLARLDTGYAFTDTLTLYLSTAYESYDVDNSFNQGFNMPDSQQSVLFATVVDINRLKYYDYFHYGLLIRGEFAELLPANDNSKRYETATLYAAYYLKVFDYQRAALKLRGFTGSNPEVAKKRIGGKNGFKTLPAEMILTDRYFSATTTYEHSLLKFSWGVVTASAFWEHGMFNTENGSLQTFYGPGAAFFVYMKKIALPAIGINYGYNVITKKSEYSFSAGISF